MSHDHEAIVFYKNGEFAKTDLDDLHDYTTREDYGFAFALQGSDELISQLCEEHGFDERDVGELVSEALFTGLMAGGITSMITYSTQTRYDDPE